MTEQDIKQNFSKNLCALRKSRGLTQLQLAEKLNYSDKSISKWEKGDVLPDISTFSMVAQFFGVTVDELIGYCKPKKILNKNKHGLITLMSCGLVFFLACVAFLICSALLVANSWMIFIYALPAASVVAIVFCSLWFGDKLRAISVSVLVWMACLAFYLSFVVFSNNSLWFVFIVGLVFQLLVILWFAFLKNRNKH
jgi:transcriptional regulator with XRE-family HTH domain